jgi:hypothetical protein
MFVCLYVFAPMASEPDRGRSAALLCMRSEYLQVMQATLMPSRSCYFPLIDALEDIIACLASILRVDITDVSLSATVAALETVAPGNSSGRNSRIKVATVLGNSS